MYVDKKFNVDNFISVLDMTTCINKVWPCTAPCVVDIKCNFIK